MGRAEPSTPGANASGGATSGRERASAVEPGSGAVRAPDDHTLPGAVGALVAAAALVVAAGPVGLLAGFVVLGAWYALSVPYVLALGHVALVAVLPDWPALPVLGLVEAGFLLVLVGPIARRDPEPRVAAVAVLVPLVLLAVVAAGVRWLDSLSLAALVLAAATVLLAYGLHRFELVRLGLVEP